MLEFLLSVATLVGQVDINATQTQYEFLNDNNTITTVIVDNYTPWVSITNRFDSQVFLLLRIAAAGGRLSNLHTILARPPKSCIV